MYTNETTHFGIPLPLGSDLTTPMDYNTAFEAVDEALFESQGDASAANANAAAAVETANATSEALGTLSTTVGGHTSQIAALGARMTNAENNIDDVRSDLEDMITAYNEPTATSTHVYSAGDYFIYNDVLYKATTSISIGETIVPNTNCMATNVTTEVKDVKSALVNHDSVTITANASETRSQLLARLYALIDTSKITPNSKLLVDDKYVYPIAELTTCDFAYLDCGGLNSYTAISHYILSTGNAYSWIIQNNGNSYNDDRSSTSTGKIQLFY